MRAQQADIKTEHFATKAVIVISDNARIRSVAHVDSDNSTLQFVFGDRTTPRRARAGRVHENEQPIKTA